MSGPAEDRQLIEAAARGDGDALERIVELYGRVVYNACLRILGSPADAEDAAQATFLVMLRKCRRLSRGTVLAAWLHGTARMVARRHRRSLRRRRKHEREASAMIEAREASADGLWEKVRPELDQEIAALPARYRNVLVLSYLQGRTRAEIASQLGAPEGTIGTWLARGKEKLRARLTRHDPSMSVAVLGTLLAERAAEAAPPAALLPGLKTAAGLAAGGAAAGNAVLIAEGAMKAMFWGKIKLTAAALAGVAAIGTSGAVVRKLVAGEKVTGGTKAPARAKTEKAKENHEAYRLCFHNIVGWLSTMHRGQGKSAVITYGLSGRLKLTEEQVAKAGAIYRKRFEGPAYKKAMNDANEEFLAACRKALSEKQLAELRKAAKALAEIFREYEKKSSGFGKELAKIEEETDKKLAEEVGPEPKEWSRGRYARILGLFSVEQKARFDEALAAAARANRHGRATSRQFVDELEKVLSPEQKLKMQRWKSLLAESARKHADLKARKRQARDDIVKKMIAKGASATDRRLRYVSWDYLGRYIGPEILLRGMKLSAEQHAALMDARLLREARRASLRTAATATQYHRPVCAEVLTAEQRKSFDEGLGIAWSHAVKIIAAEEGSRVARRALRRELDEIAAVPSWHDRDHLPTTSGQRGGRFSSGTVGILRCLLGRLSLTDEQKAAYKRLQDKHRINRFSRKQGETQQASFARTEKRREAMRGELRTTVLTAEQRTTFDRGAKAMEKYFKACALAAKEADQLRAELDDKLTAKLGAMPKRSGARPANPFKRNPEPAVEVF